LSAWNPQDPKNAIGNLRIKDRRLAGQSEALQIILKAQFGLSTKVKDPETWQSALIDEGYVVRTKFRQEQDGSLTISLDIAWRDGTSYFDLPTKASVGRSKKVFNTVFEDKGPIIPWGPQDFYGNAYVPPSDAPVIAQLHSDLLDCTLYPYQRRTVQFMLDRENMDIPGLKLTNASSTPADEASETLISYSKESDTEGAEMFVSRTIGTVCRKPSDSRSIHGGILAEEMGLGKTLEMIALILLHQRPQSQADRLVEGKLLPITPATLIVTPRHLLEQWEDELNMHAPTLIVKTYSRYHPADYFDECNVVLATYDDLSSEFWFVNSKRDHNLRHEKKYKPKKNTLLERVWWRVCLDEAQMIDQGVSQAATVAKLIPRVNAWAISGTPFRSHVEDLRGLLLFLGYDPFHYSHIWRRVDRPTFKDIFGRIAIRHSKDRVRNELRLPSQKRIVITIPFMAMEEQNYASLFNQMCVECGFDRMGEPLINEFYADNPEIIEKMRGWLRRLRQTCLHPHVGSKNRRAIGTGEKPLRTVDEVLDAMINNHFTHVVNHERAIVEALLHHGHVFAYERPHQFRAAKSLGFYQGALDKISSLVDQCLDAQKGSAQDHHDDPARKDKPEKGKPKKRLVTSMRQNIRLALELKHSCHFFVATANFQIKSDAHLTHPASDECLRLEAQETLHYEEAKVIRRNLLADSRKDAENAMRRVDDSQVHQINRLETPKSLSGLENVRLMEKFIKIATILNQHATLLEQWQTRVRNILLQPLIDQDDEEQTGEEYEESTKAQDELYVLFQALRTIAGDRHGLLTGQINFLTEHEAKEALKSAAQDKDWNDAAKLLLDLLKDWDNIRAKPELGSFRGVIGELRSLLTHLEWRRSGLRDDRTTQTRVDSEINLVRDNLRHLDKTLNDETKNLEALEKKLAMFRDCMNLRLTYYRRLQAISDSVQPFKETLDDELDVAHLQTWTTKKEQAEAQLSIHQSKLRFLQHLRDHATDEQSRLCIICQDEIEQGVLTSCGHQYCKDCLKEWFVQHRTCPVCKRYLHRNDLQDITYKPQNLRAQEERHPNHAIVARERTGLSQRQNSITTSSQDELQIYTDISASVLRKIKSIDLPVSYSSKVDTIIRTLLYIRATDVGAKSIIFSQYPDFLSTLSSALESVSIKHTSISDTQGTKNFRRNPVVEVFLLDAKSDSSGLNLVNATHVFLCEPLVNTALELQAIARVHRIGQMRPTTVWMILVAETVEEAVYGLSVERRREHVARVEREHQLQQQQDNSRVNGSVMTNGVSHTHSVDDKPSNEATLDAANSLALESAPLSNLLVKGSKGGGEIVDANDLWTCLFSKPAQAMVNGVAKEDMARIMRADAAEMRGMRQK
jgi:E3 ubiquitin-protein ligase SHPRH